MSIIDLNLNDCSEPTVAPTDQEHKIRIIACDPVKQDKNGNDYIMPRFEIPDLAASKEFTRYVKLATENNLSGLSPRDANSLKWQNKTFLTALGIDPSGKFKPEDDLIGKECWAILGVESDEQYGDKNYIKKFIVPK